ncbi:hypothetical protein LSH36_70g06008 [Paralvinella palmiformis]|uniref:Uncharacterized protein n=1 Tax=Paralvinella palmiformis TaxID=53620 RepID=A0AAD9NBL4_9ANNE|nr:hypothetical protein LSH36_70g06008 [Paralvinella palmiformis]
MSTGPSEDEEGRVPSQGMPSKTEPKRNKPWHRRPTITPNFGKRQKIGLKSSIGQVLLHDNVSQQQLLHAQLNNLKLEKDRTTKLLDLHKKAFLVQQSIKQRHLRATGITHVSLLPDDVANALGGTTSRHQVAPTAKEVTFDRIELDENNNNLDDDDGDGGESSKSATESGRRRHTTTIDDDGLSQEVATARPIQARSHSAADPTGTGNNFLTHDYHLRRERTVLGPIVGSNPPQQHKTRTLRALKDPRYVSLRKSLVPCSKPVDGYLQLSASGQYVLQRYGTPSVDQEHIQKLIKEMSWIRQSRRGHRNSTISAISARSRQRSASEHEDCSEVNRLVISHRGNGVVESYEDE